MCIIQYITKLALESKFQVTGTMHKAADYQNKKKQLNPTEPVTCSESQPPNASFAKCKFTLFPAHIIELCLNGVLIEYHAFGKLP